MFAVNLALSLSQDSEKRATGDADIMWMQCLS
jgi:hypothetical protein